MTNEEILEKQVEALEKLLQLKQVIVEELEAKVSKLEIERINTPSYPGLQPWVSPPFQPNISIPSVWTSDPCPTDNGHHEYPFPWHSTSPASCKKCGKQAYNVTVTSSSTNFKLDNNVTDINHPNNKLTTFTTVAKK